MSKRKRGRKAVAGAASPRAVTAATLAQRREQFLTGGRAALKFRGTVSSPAFVQEPEGNEVAERFIRTLKEQLL